MARPAITTIDRCTPAQLQALLALAAGQPDSGRSLLAYIVNYDELQRLLSEICAAMPQTRDSLLAAMWNEHTPFDTLQEIKELAKTLLVDAATPAHQAAAICLYHLACSAAIACYGVNISSRAAETHLALYEDLATVLGNTPPGHLFRRAVDRLLTLEEEKFP